MATMSNLLANSCPCSIGHATNMNRSSTNILKSQHKISVFLPFQNHIANYSASSRTFVVFCLLILGGTHNRITSTHIKDRKSPKMTLIYASFSITAMQCGCTGTLSIYIIHTAHSLLLLSVLLRRR